MKNSNGVSDANEFGQQVAFLVQNGFTPQWITSVIGNSSNGRTRAEVTAELIVGLQTLPKA